MDSPVLTVQDPLAVAGELLVDCRLPLLPVSMDISGVDVSVIRASAVSTEAAAFPPEREQSFGGGGDLLSVICPELGVAPLVDPGTDLEDELPTLVVTVVPSPAGPADMDHLTPRSSTQFCRFRWCPRRREASHPGLLPWTLAISRLVRRSEGSQRDAPCLQFPDPSSDGCVPSCW